MRDIISLLFFLPVPFHFPFLSRSPFVDFFTQARLQKGWKSGQALHSAEMNCKSAVTRLTILLMQNELPRIHRHPLK